MEITDWLSDWSCCPRGITEKAKKAAIRWSLIGVHSGNGNFGNPSNAPVYVMGISHAEFGPRGIKNEWVLFDETIIWKQILMKTG